MVGCDAAHERKDRCFYSSRGDEYGLIPVRCKEFLSASRWYFVGPPPAFGGRRPRAEAAASPLGWPPLKPLSPFRRFLIANGIISAL